MHTKADVGTEGTIGLGVLLLMTVAFVASETHSGPPTAESPELARPSMISPLLIDQARPSRDGAVEGTIRELRVIPTSIESRFDFGWAPDETLIERHWPSSGSAGSSGSPGQSGF